MSLRTSECAKNAKEGERERATGARHKDTGARLEGLPLAKSIKSTNELWSIGKKTRICMSLPLMNI